MKVRDQLRFFLIFWSLGFLEMEFWDNGSYWSIGSIDMMASLRTRFHVICVTLCIYALLL